MKNLLLLVLGILIGGAIGYFVFGQKTDGLPEEASVENESSTENAESTEQAVTSEQIEEPAREDYNPARGKFLETSTLNSRINEFDTWIKKNQITDKVFIPNSFFIGKDSLKTLIKRMDNARGGQTDPKKKMAGLTIQLTLVQDTVVLKNQRGKPYTFIGKRMDPVLIPVRIDGQQYRVGRSKSQGKQETKLLLNNDPGTLLDQSKPCPDSCPWE